MNRRKAPSVLIYSDDSTRREVEEALGRLKVETAPTSSFAAVGERLKEGFVNVAIIDACNGPSKLPEALGGIKSLSPATEIILLVPGGKPAVPPATENLVYAAIEKPLNKNFLCTLTTKALEKQSLSRTGPASKGAPAPANLTGGSPLLSASVNSLNSAVTITDMNLGIIYVNPAHVRTFGYSPEELMGKKNSVLYPVDDPSGVSGKIYEALLMVGWEGERLALRKDGSAFQAYEKTSVIKDASGKQVGIVSIIDDITSRKRLQQALKESEERYRSFVETARSAIIAVDGDGKIILFNPAAEKIFGYLTDEIINSQFSSLFPAEQKDALRLELGKGSGVTALRGTTAELTALNKQGEEFPVDVSFSTCRVDGRPITTAIIFDITERKSLQEQLLQSA
ncbi:MAG: PAS domain S-box protein, partial [Candidatus Dadabacteria bacterium]|nr:PAS domain S-box protein [Candidatus Dadabacteria bacterium]